MGYKISILALGYAKKIVARSRLELCTPALKLSKLNHELLDYSNKLKSIFLGPFCQFLHTKDMSYIND